MNLPGKHLDITEIQMQNKEQRDKESQERLHGLAMIIKEVYLPALESKPETRHSITKFTNQIHTAVQQAYGNVTIYVPPIDMEEEEEVSRNPQLIEQLQNAVVSSSVFSLVVGVHRMRLGRG